MVPSKSNELPDGWVWTRLGDLGTWTGGGTPSKANDAFWTNGTIPWVSPKDMKVDIIGETEDKITVAAVEGSSAKYVPKGSVLMVMRSGILRHSFPVAVTDRAVTLNQDLRALTPQDAVSPNYIARYLALSAQRVLQDCSKDGTTVNSVEALRLEQLAVPLAPEAEQRRIVARIDALFAEITEGEAAVGDVRKGLDTLRRALLKAAVTGELTKDWRRANPTTEDGHQFLARIAKDRTGKRAKQPARHSGALRLDISALPTLPEGWVYAALGDLAWESSYGTSVKCDTDANGVAVLRIPNVRDGEIINRDLKYATTSLNLRPADLIAPGDLLVIRTNGSESLIGRGGVSFEILAQPTYFASYLIRFRLVGGELIWRWVSRYFESPIVRQWMAGHIASSAGQYNVSQKSLAMLPVPIPPLAEIAAALHAISSTMTATLDTFATLDAEAADAARLRQSVLKAAFEGRLVQQDPADEPASALLARVSAAQQSQTRSRRRSGKRRA
jgi:type I restriction enzyme, S subunit